MAVIALIPLSPEREPLAGAMAAVPPALAGVFVRVARCFKLHSELAPGFVCIGGELALQPQETAAHGAAVISATGTGLSLADALVSFLGEAAERLSQFARPGDVIAGRGQPGGFGGWIDQAIASAGIAGQELDGIAATFLADGRATYLPADLVVRRAVELRRLQPVGALSAGCAAGASRDSARASAILELVERDAAALWWLGGSPARRLAPDCPAGHAATALLDRLRCGAATRVTHLLDITADLDVPVIAAVSMAPDGTGFACGLAASFDPVRAAAAALRELCQMEMAAPVAAMKLEQRGEAALNDADRRHLKRAGVDARESYPVVADGLNFPEPDADQPAIAPGLAGLVHHLAGRGVRLAAADLTRADIGVPVAHVLAPDLQPFAEAPQTPRLAAALAASGEAQAARRKFPLM